ncbi:hypothetical protein H0A58_12795 [Alcaligenaceae bacterium]|nr:hypothetical protein [Alcaligenaceae bacterium]
MKKILAAGLFTAVSFTAFAQQFPGAIIAEFYMEAMSVPKGWELSYKGEENKIQVFTMNRDLDTYPQTAMLQPIDQMRRVMCGDDTLKDMVNQGVKVKVNTRDKVGGKVKSTNGPILSSC